eukprot:4127730-Amphidinium_carterae.1
MPVDVGIGGVMQLQEVGVSPFIYATPWFITMFAHILVPMRIGGGLREPPQILFGLLAFVNNVGSKSEHDSILEPLCWGNPPWSRII